MKKYIFILVALAFMACEKTFFVGGTVTDFRSGDSIEGIEMGLFVLKQSSFSYDDKKWNELELISTAITNSEGFFSVEIESDFSMSGTIFLPLLPTDTLSVNAQYTPRFSEGLQHPLYGTTGEFKLKRSSHILFNLKNFTQEKITVRCGDLGAGTSSLTSSSYFSFKELLTGKTHQFDFYEVVNYNEETRENQEEYLGSCSHFIKTQLPDDLDKVFWEMPRQEIEIDFNTLEKRLFD
ncbi:MAG TPA: hypothetical protein VJY41_13790 [Prolixibacteraceae bacterium]|nr:hypothetical protein [Prolixibacteraceae bacterium]